MANIAAKDVMELRKKTGIGMMECKKALVEAEGDFDQAMKILREKGLAVAAKKSDRIAAEGVVDILKSDDGLTTAIVEVNSETDFVANNATFAPYIDESLTANLQTLMKFSDPAALTQQRTAESLADFLGMSSSDAKQLLLYYYMQHGGADGSRGRFKIGVAAGQKGDERLAVVKCSCKITHEDPPLCSGRWRRSPCRPGLK